MDPSNTMAASDDTDSSFDPRRRLCPDGSCIGIIGSDGRCTVCGKAAPAGEPNDVDVGPASAEQADGAGEAAAPDGAPGDPSGFDPKRRLCVDDTCIGIIGQDNRCATCGRPAEG